MYIPYASQHYVSGLIRRRPSTTKYSICNIVQIIYSSTSAISAVIQVSLVLDVIVPVLCKLLL
jgi:hypothetical protein